MKSIPIVKWGKSRFFEQISPLFLEKTGYFLYNELCKIKYYTIYTPDRENENTGELQYAE